MKRPKILILLIARSEYNDPNCFRLVFYLEFLPSASSEGFFCFDFHFNQAIAFILAIALAITVFSILPIRDEFFFTVFADDIECSSTFTVYKITKSILSILTASVRAEDFLLVPRGMIKFFTAGFTVSGLIILRSSSRQAEGSDLDYRKVPLLCNILVGDSVSSQGYDFGFLPLCKIFPGCR